MGENIKVQLSKGQIVKEQVSEEQLVKEQMSQGATVKGYWREAAVRGANVKEQLSVPQVGYRMARFDTRWLNVTRDGYVW